MSAVLPDMNSLKETTNNIQMPDKCAAQTITNNLENNVDAPELASLLQCMGFSLQSFEKTIDGEHQPSLSDGYLQIDITCSKSHMKATLIKEKGGCKCPSKEDATNAQFWNISACSPSLPGNVTISKSSLIPIISAEKSKVIHALLAKALEVVNSTGKKSENFGDLFKSSAAIARHRSLDNLGGETSVDDISKNASKNENFKRHSSLPKGTSSPIPPSSSGLKQDSEQACKLIEAVKTAHKLLSEALDSAANQNTTFTKRPRRISDLKISPLSTDDQKSESCNSLNATKPDTSCCKTPKKPKTPKKSKTPKGKGGILDKKKLLMPPSRLGLLKPTKSDSAVLTNNLSLSKRESPYPKNKPMKLNLSGVKSKIAAKNNTPTSRLRVPSKIASFTGTIKTPNNK